MVNNTPLRTGSTTRPLMSYKHKLEACVNNNIAARYSCNKNAYAIWLLLQIHTQTFLCPSITVATLHKDSIPNLVRFTSKVKKKFWHDTVTSGAQICTSMLAIDLNNHLFIQLMKIFRCNLILFYTNWLRCYVKSRWKQAEYSTNQSIPWFILNFKSEI